MKRRNKFDEIFADAVYETLTWIDKLVAPILSVYIQDVRALETGLRKSELNIHDAKALEKGLDRIFGFGARVFERRILETLYTKLELKKKIEQNFKFTEEVEKAKEHYTSKVHAG